jgi:N utilization substance protein B
MNQKPTIKKAALNKKRSLSRLMAVQILYQHDYFADNAASPRNIEEITHDVIENYALELDETTTSYRDKIEENFLNDLVNGATPILQTLDDEIGEFLQNGWSVDSIDDIMHQILRLGTFELKFLRDTPLKVVIDEYVDIAAAFFDINKVTFANATLENLAKKIRPEEFEKIKK